jgi:flagellar M-ring protein FliF
VLERALGPGQAMATVDVILNHDQSRVTVEDVLPAHGNAGDTPSGVIVRQRQVVRDGAAVSVPAADGPVRREPGSGHLEIDYQVGRRTVAGRLRAGCDPAPRHRDRGARRRDKAQLERIRNLVAVAVGYDSDRGDGIAVYSMEQLPCPAGHV